MNMSLNMNFLNVLSLNQIKQWLSSLFLDKYAALFSLVLAFIIIISILCMMGDLCSDYVLTAGLLHHILTCTMKEMASLMISMRKDTQAACIHHKLWREEKESDQKHQCGKSAMSWRCLRLLSSSHGWREYFCIKAKDSTSMSADDDGNLKSLTEQKLTEREWRRPLTWLDRFREAVLLPASWGDEDFQPHVGNKCLKLFFSVNQFILVTEHILWIK